ncbi:MAG TPA: hypothetical protein VFD90_04380 [Gaiellales bacterium]|jgi:hypothetical protein|nr:hypothetical protein [Gaiellales bacterium]
MQRNPFDDASEAERQRRPTPSDERGWRAFTSAIRHLVGTGLAVTALLALVGGTMFSVAFVMHLAAGADVF